MFPINFKNFNCPSCGNSIVATAGQITLDCPICKQNITIPEESRVPGVSNADAVRVVWGRVVQLAQEGERREAIELYMEAPRVNRLTASGIVDSLAKTDPQEMNDPDIAAQIYSRNPVARAKIVGGMLLDNWKLLAIGCGPIAFIIILGIICAGISYFLISIWK